MAAGSACSIQQVVGVGLIEPEARKQRGEDIATRTFPWIANAGATMQNATTGGASLSCTRHGGALPGLVLIGKRATDVASRASSRATQGPQGPSQRTWRRTRRRERW
jgi:pyruvate/2-oxoglutarate dehydrogenase complex dihydrolipoamide dehydrogenase (E3) component